MSSDEKTRQQRKKNLLFALAAAAGYIIVYFAGRIFGTVKEPASVWEWLFGCGPRQFSYLYGWLLHQKIFWIAMAVSVIPALFGKKFFSFTTLAGFAIGLTVGELCGHNPPGDAYGHGHYGWFIWGCIFLFSAVMGICLEKLARDKLDLKSRKLWIWSAVFAVGIFLIVFMVRMNMPSSFS